MKTSWKTLQDVWRDQNIMRKIPRKEDPVVRKRPSQIPFSRSRCEIQTTGLKQREKGLSRMIAENHWIAVWFQKVILQTNKELHEKNPYL